MKIKDQLRNLAIAIVVIFGMYSQISYAANCDPRNASPTIPCDNLQFTTTTPAGAMSIDVVVTGTASGTPALTIESGVTSGNISIGATGVLQNFGTSPVFTGGTGITSAGSITSLINNGIIKAPSPGGDGIFIGGGHIIGSLVNSGSIAGGRYAIHNNGTITELTNTATTGSPTSGIYGSGTAGGDILNLGTIGTLNNAQSNTALVLYGILPTNYNIIINSPTSYGTFTARSVNGGSNPTGGPMTFGIYAGSTITAKTYSTVLTGIPSTKLTNTTGTYQGLTWALTPNGSTQYDLNFTGSNTAVTTVNSITAQGLQTAFALQNTVLVNGFTYDCPLFDKNNVCVSAGGRYTAVDAQSVNSGAGVLIGAYRWNNQVRFGAYIDQNVSTNTTGIIKVSNGSPMVGLFGVWSERLDGTGAEVRVSAGYGQKNTTMTRPVIDGTEPGSGSSTLTSQGAQAIAKYGFGVTDNAVVAPYAGLRYTQNNMNGYSEGASASVTAPLTYAPLNTNATTIVAGLGATYKIIPAVTLLASAGVESDTNTNYSSYSATGLYGLTEISMNPNPKYTRPTGMLGAYYDVEKNQRISLTGVYRQAPYQGVGATTYMALYTIGL
jgi:hypothetical protein